MIDNKDKRVPGNALVGEPVREINRWKNRTNPSDDDVPVLQVAESRKSLSATSSWSSILQRTANQRRAEFAT